MKFLCALILCLPLLGVDVKLVRMKSMPESKIIHRGVPQVPRDAADLHIHGVVKLNVVIGLDGHVESAKVASGHPLLIPAALQSVRQWIFEPTLVDEKPVRVATEIEIPFEFDADGHPIEAHGPAGERRRVN
jgi:TonB family protein